LLCCSARYLYWASKDIPDNPTERINNVEFLYERQFHPNVGNAVMASSYALLCYLAHNNMTHAVPIMKFITSQRNHLMGWSSTSVRTLLFVTCLIVGAVDLTLRLFVGQRTTVNSVQCSAGFTCVGALYDINMGLGPESLLYFTFLWMSCKKKDYQNMAP